MGKEEEKKEERPKYKTCRTLMLACGFFDESYNGYFKATDLEDILMFGGLGLTKAYIKKIIKDAEMGREEKNYGRLLSMIPIDYEIKETQIVKNSLNCVSSEFCAKLDTDNLRQKMDSLTALKDAALDKADTFKNDYERAQRDIQKGKDKIERLEKESKEKSEKMKAKQQENVAKIQELTKNHKEKLNERKEKEAE